MKLTVTSGLIATLLQEAAATAPNECCGLLLGRGGRIDEARSVANIHADPLRHFEIDPAALIAAHRAAREGGLDVIGYYHSHPTGQLQPSVTDRECASGDGRIWAIVAKGEVGFWRDAPSAFEALSYAVIAG